MARLNISKLNLVGALTASLLFAGMAGCTKPEDSASTPGKNGADGSGSASKSSLTVKGSDTMVQLAQSWAQEFMKAHPEISVSVTGGGSNTGIAALINKGTDIADASRPIKDEERKSAADKGVDVQEFTVARDALSIIVNPSNPIAELTLAQLKDLYTGKVTNWKQVGGPDMNVVLNARDTSSGTYVFFQEHVLNKEPYAATAMNLPSTSQIVDGVGQDKGAIGYVGLGYVSAKVKSIKIKGDASSPAVEATLENVVGGTYPLSRPLFAYTNGKPAGAVQTWLDWVRGPDGQEIVKKMGFVPAK